MGPNVVMPQCPRLVSTKTVFAVICWCNDGVWVLLIFRLLVTGNLKMQRQGRSTDPLFGFGFGGHQSSMFRMFRVRQPRSLSDSIILLFEKLVLP
jgi:hypothetical protein